MNIDFVSPVDALVFDYLRFGIFAVVNNLWTWLAVVTAAVSFWRIRASAVAGKSEPPAPPISACIERNSNGSQPVFVKSPPIEAEAVAKPTPMEFSVAPSVFEVDGVTKGKFVAYYERESCDDGECEGEEGDELTVVGDGGRGGGEWWESWERLLRMRNGEMGWYGCQDLKVFNGNVVRLWDGVRREKYSSGCVVYGRCGIN